MPSKRSEEALIERQRVAESYGYQFEFRGQTEGFATVKMSLNTDKGVVNLLIRDTHFKLKRPEDSDYTKQSLTEFTNTLEEVFSNYRITEYDKQKETSSSNVKKVA